MSVEYTNDQLLKMVQYLQQIRDMSKGENGTKISAALAESVSVVQREEVMKSGGVQSISEEAKNLTDETFKQIASNGDYLKIVIAEVVKNLHDFGLSLESIERRWGPATSGTPVRQNQGEPTASAPTVLPNSPAAVTKVPEKSSVPAATPAVTPTGPIQVKPGALELRRDPERRQQVETAAQARYEARPDSYNRGSIRALEEDYRAFRRDVISKIDKSDEQQAVDRHAAEVVQPANYRLRTSDLGFRFATSDKTVQDQLRAELEQLPEYQDLKRAREENERLQQQVPVRPPNAVFPVRSTAAVNAELERLKEFGYTPSAQVRERLAKRAIVEPAARPQLPAPVGQVLQVQPITEFAQRVNTPQAVRIVTEGEGQAARVINPARSVAIFAEGSREGGENPTRSQDSLGYLHNKVTGTIIAAVADGVGSSVFSEVGAAILKGIVMSIPDSAPFTHQEVIARAAQVTPQQFATKGIEMGTFHPAFAQAATNPSATWSDFQGYFSQNESDDWWTKNAKELNQIGSSTLSAYRRTYDPDRNDYNNEFLQIGDSPIHAPDLGIYAGDVGESADLGYKSSNTPVQLRWTAEGPDVLGINSGSRQLQSQQIRSKRPVSVILASDGMEADGRDSSGLAFKSGMFDASGRVNEEQFSELYKNREQHTRADDQSFIAIGGVPIVNKSDDVNFQYQDDRGTNQRNQFNLAGERPGQQSLRERLQSLPPAQQRGYLLALGEHSSTASMRGWGDPQRHDYFNYESIQTLINDTDNPEESMRAAVALAADQDPDKVDSILKKTVADVHPVGSSPSQVQERTTSITRKYRADAEERRRKKSEEHDARMVRVREFEKNPKNAARQKRAEEHVEALRERADTLLGGRRWNEALAEDPEYRAAHDQWADAQRFVRGRYDENDMQELEKFLGFTESDPKPALAPVVAPVVETKPKPAPAPVVETKPKPKPTPAPVVETKPKPAPVVETKPVPAPVVAPVVAPKPVPAPVVPVNAIAEVEPILVRSLPESELLTERQAKAEQRLAEVSSPTSLIRAKTPEEKRQHARETVKLKKLIASYTEQIKHLRTAEGRLRKNNVFPANSLFEINPEELSSEMLESLRNLLKSVGTIITAAGDETGSAYRAAGKRGSPGMVLRALEHLYQRTAVKTQYGEEYLPDVVDADVGLRQLPSIVRVLKHAITRTKREGLRDPSEVLRLGVGAHLDVDRGVGTITAGDVREDSGYDSGEGTPSTMSRPRGTVYFDQTKTSTYRGQQALRTAMGRKDDSRKTSDGADVHHGSQIVGFGTKDVFPALVVDRVKARIEEQERIARAQLAAGETTSMQVGTTTYDNVPRIIADSQLAIMRSAGRASEITGLTKLGNKRGPYGELEGNHSIDMLANLHLGKMFQSLTTTGEIPADLTENFLLSTAAQENNPSLLPDSVKPEQEANNLQVMAQRHKEKLAYYQRVGEENLAANADQSPSQLAMEEISSLAMQQRLLDELMTTAEDPDEEKLRRKRRGQIIYPKEHQANLRKANSHVIPELSSDEALFALYGDSVLTDAYPATFLNIREQGQSVKDYIHSTGGNTQATRSYDKFGSVARAVKAATASDSRDADELYNSIIPEDYQAQLDSSGTSKAKMLDGKEVDVSHTTGMVEKDISYILNDMYGLSAQKDHNIFNAMYHAGRATDEQGNLLDPAQLRASMGGTTKHGLESIHRGAQDLQDISRTGIPLVEYAKLRTQEVLPGQEEAHQQALDRIHAVSPALAELNDSQVQALSQVDYKQEASQVLTQIIKTVGTSIQKRVAEAIQKKGRAAGYSDDQLVDMFVDNKETGRAPAGFESLFRQFNLFNPATIESNPEFLRAMTLLMDVQTEAARGETAADFTARALGTTTTVQGARTAAQMQSANLPHAIQREGYGLQASARAFIQDETGRAPRAVIKRQALGSANLQKLEQELQEATSKKKQLEEQHAAASGTRESLLRGELLKAIEIERNAEQALRDARFTADPTTIDTHFARLSAIASSDGASPESRQAAMTELSAAERIRALTSEYPDIMQESVQFLYEHDTPIVPGIKSYLGPESGYAGDSQVERLRGLEEHIRLTEAAKVAHPDSDAHTELAFFESERNRRIANYSLKDTTESDIGNANGFVGLSAGTNTPVTTGQRELVQRTSLAPVIMQEAMSDRNDNDLYAAPVRFNLLEDSVNAISDEEAKRVVGARPATLITRVRRALKDREKISKTYFNSETQKQFQVAKLAAYAHPEYKKSLDATLTDEERSEATKAWKASPEYKQFVEARKADDESLEWKAFTAPSTDATRLADVFSQVKNVHMQRSLLDSNYVMPDDAGIMQDVQQILSNMLEQTERGVPRQTAVDANALAAEVKKIAAKDRQVTRKNKRKISAAQLKTARGTQAELYGKEEMTQDERQRLSAAQEILRVYGVQTVRKNFGDDTSQGIPQLYDILSSITPQDWDTSPEAMQRRGVAGSVASIVDSLDPSMLALAKNADFTTSRGRNWLGTKDPRWKAIIAQLDSIPDIKKYTRSRDRGLRGAVRADAMTSVSDAAAKSVTDAAEGAGPAYFDLETNIPRNAAGEDDKSLKRTIFQASVVNGTSKVPTVMYAVASEEIAKQIKAMAAEVNAVADTDTVRRLELLRQMHETARTDVYGGKDTEVNPEVIRSLVAHALSGGMIHNQESIRASIKSRIGDATQVVGHNVKEFDLPVLYDGGIDQAAIDTVPEDIMSKAVDTLALSRDISPGSHRLIDSYKRFVDPAGFAGAHDAGQDVLATRALHGVVGRRGAAMGKLDMSAIPAELHPYITDSSKVGAGDPRAKQFAVLTGTYKALSTMEDYTQKHGVEGQKMDARTMENMEKMFPGIGAKTPEEAAELKKQIQEQYLDKYQHLAVDGSFRSASAFLQRRADFDKTKPYWGSYAGMRENLSRGLSIEDMVGAAAEGVGVHAKRVESTAGTAAAAVAGGAAETRRTGSRMGSYGAGGAGGGGGSGGSFTMSGGGDVPGGGGGGGPIIIHVGRAEIYVQNGHVAGTSEGGDGKWPGGSYTGGGTGMDAGVESTDKDPDTGGSFSAGVAGAGMGSRRTGPKDAYVDPAGSEASAGSSVSVGPISATSLDGVTTVSASAFTIQNATIQQVVADVAAITSTGGPVTVTAQFSKEGAAAYDKSLVYVKNTGDASIEGNVSMGGGRGGSGGPRFPASVTGILSQMDYDRATTAAKLGTERDPALRASLQSDLMTRGYANMRGALNSEEFAGVRKLNVGGNNVGDLVELVTSIPELAVPELNATNVVAAAEQQHQAAITAGADEDTIAEYAAVVASARQFTEALRELNKAFQQTEQSSRTNAPYERGTDAKTGSTYTTDGLRKYNNEMAPYRGALNNIEVMRGYYTAQLSKEKDPVVAETLRAKMMSEFAGSAKGILGHSTFADVLGMDVGGVSVQSAVDRVQHDPVTGLGMLNYMAEGMTTQTGSALDVLKASGTATEEEIKQAQARNNKAHEFVATLGEFSKAYRDVTYSQKTTPPYDRTAGAGGVGGVGVGGVAGKRGVYDPTREAIVNSIEAARNAYDQSGGLFSGRNIFQSKGDLTDRTISAAQNLVGLRQGFVTASGAALMAGLPNPKAAMQYAQLETSFTGLQDAATIEQASAAMLQLLSSIESLTQTISSETGPGIDEFKDNLQGLGKLASTGTMQLNKTAKTQQQTESLQIGKMEERVQAAVTQTGIFNFGRRREDKKAALRDFAEGFLGDKADTLYDEKRGELSLPQLTETVDATGKRVLKIDPRKSRKGLQRVSDEDLQRHVEYLNQLDPSNPVTFESLSKTQRAYARAQQSQNQAPFADKMFYAASKLRDLQFFAQGIAGIPQIPQQIMQTIEMATSPALSAERTMTTARSLSLTPQVYNAALSAAAGQQARFGGSLSSNVGKITDFIPLTNAYGVDMTKSLNVARKLAAFDPAQGMQGASIALKEFLSGNVSSLSRRFEINRSALSKINTGDATEMLNSLDNVLSSMGVTDKLIDDQANTMATKYDKMVGRLDIVGQNLSGMLVNAVTPALESMLGSDSGIATTTGNKTLSKLTSESLQSYGDATLSNKVTGLSSLDPYADPAKFSKDLDNVLRMANNDIAVQARGYSSGTGLVPQLAPYRMTENASATQRFSMQHSVMKYLDQGMGKEQAYLQALRENQGDFNTSQEFLFQRNPINGLNMSAPNQYLGGLVRTKPGNLTLAGVLPKGPDLSTPEAQARIFGTYGTLGTMSAATPGGLSQQQIDIIGSVADRGLMLESMGYRPQNANIAGAALSLIPGAGIISQALQATNNAGNEQISKMSTPDLANLARKMGTAAYATVLRRKDNDTVELLDEYGKTFTARISNIDAPEHTATAGNTSIPKNDVLGRSLGLTQADYVITQADRNEYLRQAQASGMTEAQAKKMIDAHGYDKTLIKVASQPRVLAVGDSQDRYERKLASLFTTDKNGNLVAVNRKMAELGGAPVAFSNLPEQARTAMEVLAKNAADTKLGAVNTQAAGLDLGGNAIISQQARDAYFQRHYLGMGETVGMATGVAGAGTLGLHLGGGAIMSAFPGSAAATAIESAGAIGAGGVFGVAGGIGLAAGLGYGAYAYSADMNDTSVAKQRELYEIQAKMNTQENQRRRSMNYVYNAGLLPNTERAKAAAINGGGEAFRSQTMWEKIAAGFGSIGNNPGMPGIPIENLTPVGSNQDANTQVALDMADQVSKEMEKTKDEFAKRRETAPDSVKKVYDQVVINPMDPGTAEHPNYISVLDLQQTLTAIDTVALSSGNEQFQHYADTPAYVRARAGIANQTDPEKQKINDLLEKNKITIPRRILKGGPDYIRNRLTSAADAESFTFNTADMLKYSAAEQDNIYRYGLDQLGSLRNYSQPANEYQDQAMSKMVGLRNQRFTSFMDANALNAMFMGHDNTTSPIGLRGTSGVKAAALNMLDQSYFIKNNAGDQGQINAVRSAQTQAVDAMLEQARAFKEQADMARPFTTLYKSTFANLIMGMNIAQENFQQIFDTMGQGNPLFAIDFAKQSTGLDWKQSIASQLYVPGFNQQGVVDPTQSGFPLRPGLMAGTFQVPYATGPRASIRYANDLLNDKQTTGMLNPAEMLNIFQSAAQGQTEIVRRQIQFNNQMRDLNLNHNRALEDIARNGMRQLEDIHINYTRQMIQLTQQNEISKRMDRASVNKNIESADITQADRVQAHVVQESGQMFARHAGQSNPQGFLARVQGTALENDPQVVALREALAKYNSISYDNSGAKQAAWDKVIEARNPLEGKIKQMMEGATPQDTANYESYLALLGRDPAREAAAQNYSNQRTSQFVETAAERKSLLKQKEELLYQQNGEGLTRRQLQKNMQDANASGDPLQIAAAKKAMEDFDINSQKTADAIALVSQKLSAISNTSEMFADAWTEAFASITNNASTTVLGLVQSLDDFNRKMQQQLDDQDLQFGRQVHDLKQAFIDAAREIATQVPGEMAKGYTAVMTYMAEQSRAEALMLSGNYEDGKNQMFANMNRLGDALYGTPDSDAKKVFLANLEKNIPASDKTATGVELPSNGIAAALAKVNGKWALRVTYQSGTEDSPANPAATKPEDDGRPRGSFTLTPHG